MPLIVLTASSILSVISVSICSGAAPGWTRGDHDGREVDLREAVDAELRERERADDGERQDEHRREDRTANAERGEPLHDSGFSDAVDACACRRSRAAADVACVSRRARRPSRPLAISTCASTRLADRDDALLDVVAVDDEDAAGAADASARRRRARGRPGVLSGCSMRAVANSPGFSSPPGFGDDGLDGQRALVGLERGRDVADRARERRGPG